MRILTAAEFSDGNIPNSSDFKESLEMFESTCVTSYLGKEVVSAMPYGSVMSGDPSILSDIDYLLIISDDSHLGAIQKSISQVYNNLHVPMQVNTITQRNAQNGIHTLDPSFAQHLEHVKNVHGYKGEDPFKIIKPNSHSFNDSLFESMARYVRKMNDGFTHSGVSEKDRISFLKSILEKPFHAMRVANQYAQGGLGENYLDTKSHLIKVYNSLGYDSSFAEDIEAISEGAKSYLKVVEDRRGPVFTNPDEDDHDEELQKIENLYPKASHFIQGNLEIMLEKRSK